MDPAARIAAGPVTGKRIRYTINIYTLNVRTGLEPVSAAHTKRRRDEPEWVSSNGGIRSAKPF
jgi:hypothetical protein